jgi:hypothetical protein
LSWVDLLRDLGEPGFFLTFTRRSRLVLWSPNQYVPQHIRMAIRAYSHMLRALVENADYRVCTNYDLHRQYWRYAGREGWYVCEACERLNERLSA